MDDRRKTKKDGLQFFLAQRAELDYGGYIARKQPIAQSLVIE